MCGINGILHFNSYESDKPDSYFEEQIGRMNDEIAHRGPDGTGMMIEYPVCFGFRRLSIIDLSENGNQPMFNEDRSIAIIFNGEIYNYLELIPDLKNKGHIFRTKSDTEVIIHSYEEYGFDCVNRFNGMWAFAIWDFKKKLLFASRDRMGVKPFYYFRDKDQFIFSSEIKAILKIKNIRNANRGKVFDYVAYGYKTSNGETFFENIHELKPARNLIIRDNDFNETKYWSIKENGTVPKDPEAALKSLIYDSVRLRFRSDVPVSILLSGGLDSSIITKVTDELVETRQLPGENVTAFTAVFPGFIYNESEQVRKFLRTCRHINSIEISPGSNLLLDVIDKFVYGMGEPVFSATSFAHFTLMKEIHDRGMKVVLNGQGADEAWCGYDRYIIGYFLLDMIFSNPAGFISQYNAISEKMKFSNKFILLQILKALISRKYGSYLRAKHKEKIIPVLDEGFFLENYSHFLNPVYSKFSSSNLRRYLKYNIDYQGFSQILHYEDHSSMQHSIEMRSPFVDYRLVDFAFSLPDKKKFDDGVTKKILREIFRKELPESVIGNYRKIGFATPFDNWINSPDVRSYINELLNSESFRNKKIFDAGKIQNIFSSNTSGKDFPLWRIVNLELWSRQYKINNL